MTRYLGMVAAGLMGMHAAAMGSSSDPWTIESGTVDPTHYFGITVGNGMIGIVSAPSPLRAHQTLIAGAYEASNPGDVSNILSTFNPVGLALEIDGERIDNLNQVSNFRQKLGMKDAVFTTTFDVRDKASITYEVRALRQLPYAALAQLSIVAKRPIEITAKGVLEAPTYLVGETIHAEAIPSRSAPGGTIQLLTATAQGPGRGLVAAASQTFIFDGPPDAERRAANEADRLSFAKRLTAGTTYRFSVVGSTVTSAQVSDPLNASQRMTLFAALQGIGHLIEGHNSQWADLWKSDIVIEGDTADQRDIHSFLYHLYSFARAGSGYSVAPMGLSGDGYHGHIFWDAELWMFPVLLALHSDLAESMLDYRYERLPAARRNAMAHGYRGAMFPWESAASGDEDTPVLALSGPLEHHITADIGIAAWNFYRVTRNERWLREKGYALISETADFWVSRVSRHGPGHYDIGNVVGADEFAENVDNNAFTNAVARENLAAASAAAKVLKIEPNPEWDPVRENIPILHFPDGVTREHATYDGEVVKQADVNLLAYPLGVVWDSEAIRRDLEYYIARFDARGPAMTKSILAVLYERLGMPDKAYTLFKGGLEPHQRPPFGVIAESAVTSNPYFATGAGGFLQTLLYGFGGLRITDEGLVQDKTNLPAFWRSLTLTGIGPRQQTFTVAR